MRRSGVRTVCGGSVVGKEKGRCVCVCVRVKRDAIQGSYAQKRVEQRVCVCVCKEGLHLCAEAG